MPLEKEDLAYLWDILDSAIVVSTNIPELIKQIEPLLPDNP